MELLFTLDIITITHSFHKMAIFYQTTWYQNREDYHVNITALFMECTFVVDVELSSLALSLSPLSLPSLSLTHTHTHTHTQELKWHTKEIFLLKLKVIIPAALYCLITLSLAI
jgi:hypothetical protein